MDSILYNTNVFWQNVNFGQYFGLLRNYLFPKRLLNVFTYFMIRLYLFAYVCVVGVRKDFFQKYMRENSGSERQRKRYSLAGTPLTGWPFIALRGDCVRLKGRSFFVTFSGNRTQTAMYSDWAHNHCTTA